MATLKEFDAKIGRLRSTRKLTRTMKMVSANKLRRSQERLKQAAEYEKLMGSMLGRSAAGLEQVSDALCAKRDVQRSLVLLVTSDRGLCGGFNNNLHRALSQWIQGRDGDPDRVRLSFCGRRGYLYFRSRSQVEKYYQMQSAKPVFSQAHRIYHELQSAFLAGRYDEVYIAYNRFASSLSQIPTIEKLLPVDWPDGGKKEGPRGWGLWLLQPHGPELIRGMLEGAGASRLFTAMVASAAGEHGARMTAMENSTNNADNLIQTYSLLRNRARQAAITRELTEIVAGADALK
jgi:F-type H+-transporting ATPase subunit gamma